ncbi:MAG TPA: hypothetical protein VFB29_00450 [Pseudolabrys sp.]|nr:hypothetical protein [Pseudolabrys sp.]
MTVALKLKSYTATNLKLKVPVPFPAQVSPSGPVTVIKQLGVWILGLSTSVLGITQAPQASAFATDFVLVFDEPNQTWLKMSLADLAAATAVGWPPVFDSAAGDYTVTTETLLLVNKSVPAAHNINLPAASSRLGRPILIKDYAGNASTNVATIVPNGADTIDGLSALPINSDYGGFKLAPIAGGRWIISP